MPGPAVEMPPTLKDLLADERKIKEALARNAEEARLLRALLRTTQRAHYTGAVAATSAQASAGPAG